MTKVTITKVILTHNVDFETWENEFFFFYPNSSLSFLYTVQKSLKHRRVKHFGYEFHYENNSVDKDKPLPGGK